MIKKSWVNSCGLRMSRFRPNITWVTIIEGQKLATWGDSAMRDDPRIACRITLSVFFS
jgi:hypothetical protein